MEERKLSDRNNDTIGGKGGPALPSQEWECSRGEFRLRPEIKADILACHISSYSGQLSIVQSTRSWPLERGKRKVGRKKQTGK